MITTEDKLTARAIADRLLNRITFDNVSEVSFDAVNPLESKMSTVIKAKCNDYLVNRIANTIGIVQNVLFIFQNEEITIRGYIIEFDPDNVVTVDENYENLVHATIRIVRTDKGHYE
jgi:hypothetical protein